MSMGMIEGFAFRLASKKLAANMELFEQIDPSKTLPWDLCQAIKRLNEWIDHIKPFLETVAAKED